MKKTGILAVALSAAMLAVPLAACGEAAEYNPADYAYALQSEEAKELLEDRYITWQNNALYANSTKVNGEISTFDDDLPVAKLTKANGKYVLYDLKNAKTLLNGKEFDEIEYSPEYHMLSVVDATDPDNVKRGLYTVTGDEFLSLGAYEDVDINSVDAYLNGSYDSTTVYSVTYKTGNASKGTTKYYTFDKKTNKTTIVSSSEFRTTAYDLSVGATANAVELREIYDNEKENPLSAYAYSFEISGYVDNPISDVTYSGTITVYKDGAVANTASLKNAALLGAVGNYLYYYEVTALSQSAKNYNVEYQTEDNGVISTQKFNYTLYRYDVVKGEGAKEVKADYLYYIGSLRAMYNNTAKAYDKAAVIGYKFEKGVAFISDQVKSSKLIVDDTLAVSYDMSGISYSVANLIQLKENRYLAISYGSGYILNENLEVVATLPSVRSVYAEKQLIVCIDDSRVMAVDFDGKVVFEPKYSSLNFYGDYALTTVYEKSGNSNAKMIVSTTDLDGKSLEDLFTDYGNEGVNYIARSSGYILKTVTSGTTDITTTYSVYNFAGTKIVDLDGTVSDTVTVNGTLLLTVVDSEDAISTYVIS